ncbi:SCP2 sterol-binding domain-containing protein [Shimia sp. R11_0]|uniref:Putative sterol carrier protein n=1 Tax=Shimia marina TaxID=321267 RepID=A0A0P1FAR4_9RHOB|nr:MULTISPECIES: SCP2 sterol-binding domain-containing protein [Shimia]MBO9476136.1 SCP2 sterol-binding domain-containing protein [Shimia sp. R11_0]CUH51485.1 Putative sterol carrier protein [Shimia marina]SFD47914.1 Putative sterol carrier protein [Shimia marina]
MLAEITEKMADALKTRNFDGSLKFDCGDAGVIVLAEGTASQEDRDTDCTVAISEANLVKLLAGDLKPTTALMLGKLKVSGDMGTAMKLGQLLS